MLVMFSIYLDINPQIIDSGFIINENKLKFTTVSIFIKREITNKTVTGNIINTFDSINMVENFLKKSIEIGKLVIAQDKLIEVAEKI